MWGGPAHCSGLCPPSAGAHRRNADGNDLTQEPHHRLYTDGGILLRLNISFSFRDFSDVGFNGLTT